MNILLISSGGPPSKNEGLEAMRSAIRTIWRDCKLVVLHSAPPGADVEDLPRPWAGASIGAHSMADLVTIETDLSETDQDVYCLSGATPTDLVDLAHLRADLFLTRAGLWDFVMIGCDPGPVTSVPDTLRNSAAAAGLYATAAYGAASLVTVYDGHKVPDHAPQSLTAAMRNHYAGAGETLIMNLPRVQPRSIEYGPLTHYSTIRTPPTGLVPRARDERSAHTLLQQGALTITKTALRLNPELRY